MNVLQALIIGIAQGLTEFLPVSSSGHMLVLETLFGINTSGDDMLLFMVLMHLGTLLSVCVVYWKRILNMILHPIQSELKWLILATIPTIIAAVLFDFDDVFEGKFLCWSFWLTSVVLLAGDIIGKRIRASGHKVKEVGLPQALSMGIMQAVAILPGLSRSGSTIAGGLFSGLNRKKAANFSFLMSIPAICGSIVLEGYKFVTGEIAAPSIEIMPIVVGILAAAVFGFLAIKLMLRIIKNSGMKWFALYTFLLGGLILLDKFVTHIFVW